MNNSMLTKWLYIAIAVMIVFDIGFYFIATSLETVDTTDETCGDISESETTIPTEVGTAPVETIEPQPSTEPENESTLTEITPTEPETESTSTEPAPTEVPEGEDTTIPQINEEDLEMLAIVIYQEAGGDACCDECRRRVADVVLNRVVDDRFPDTIEKVLTQYYQYGTLWKTGIRWPSRATNPGEKEAVARAYRIAEEVLRGQHSELYGEGYVFQSGFNQTSDYIKCCGIYFAR